VKTQRRLSEKGKDVTKLNEEYGKRLAAKDSAISKFENQKKAIDKSVSKIEKALARSYGQPSQLVQVSKEIKALKKLLSSTFKYFDESFDDSFE
jgi:hypothetical protein